MNINILMINVLVLVPYTIIYYRESLHLFILTRWDMLLPDVGFSVRAVCADVPKPSR